MNPLRVFVRGSLAAAGSVVLAVAAAPALAASDGDQPAAAVPLAATHPSLPPGAKLGEGLQTSGGRHTVFVQLTGSGAVDASGRAQVLARRGQIEASARAAFRDAHGSDAHAHQLYTVTNAVPGFAATVDGAALQALAQRSDVVRITPLVPQKLTNASTAQLTRAVDTWRDHGNTGAGVKVGIIDSGIDYTHADFGGPGTPAAYQQAKAHDSEAWTPTAKVVGGYDFVGDDYNADPRAADYQPVPHPDPNPLGCGSHGTHVAGIVGGYGENADGSTFHGDYASLSGSDLYNMKIGPGMAPQASLYALKVFGCDGSTDAVIPALDWALDPNGDGNFSDHLDIVNLSLGSDSTPADDPENEVIDQLATHGVLPVVAAGNAGDITDAAGAPGNAIRSLAVASSVDEFQLRDGLRVNAPSNLAGVVAGQFSEAYPWATAAPVTGDVVALSADDADGCRPLSAADAAAVAGKVAWLEWDENDATRRCGSVGRSANVAAAGAIGAVLTSSLDVFGAGITGSTTIPVIQLPATETASLRPALTAGTLNVTFDGSLAASVKDRTPAITDLVSSFSSRGDHGSIGVVKPDITAPGDTIASAGLGSGNGVLVESGTSMATPNVAGIAALAKVAHPGWSTEQLKADLMNTAGHDLYSSPGQSSPIYGPARVGAGRVDAKSAVDNTLLAYDADVPGAVSASFGVVTAPVTSGTLTRTRHVTIANQGSQTTTATLSYAAATTQPGVSYSVSPRSVKVRAGGTATATVTMTVQPTALRRTIDPTEAPTETNPLFGNSETRQFVPAASGRLLVTPTGGSSLRVPVYGAARPSSQTSASASHGRLRVSGTGVAQGTGVSSYTSLLSVLQLGDTSPKAPVCTGTQVGGCTAMGSDSSGDIRYVGAGSVPGAHGYADGMLWFGVNTYGAWATPGHSVTPYVSFDTNGDGKPDYLAYVQELPSSDLYYAYLEDLNSGQLIDAAPVNFETADVDTNLFDSDTILIPVNLAAISGLTPTTTSFPITYQVGEASSYTGKDIDDSAAVSYNVAKPGVATSAPLWSDQGRTSIAYTTSGTTRGVRALVLHLDGAPGHRAEVLALPGH